MLHRAINFFLMKQEALRNISLFCWKFRFFSFGKVVIFSIVLRVSEYFVKGLIMTSRFNRKSVQFGFQKEPSLPRYLAEVKKHT